MTEPTLSERLMKVALLGVVPADDQHVIADAQEEIDNLRRGDNHNQEERAKLEDELADLRKANEILRRLVTNRDAERLQQLNRNLCQSNASLHHVREDNERLRAAARAYLLHPSAANAVALEEIINHEQPKDGGHSFGEAPNKFVIVEQSVEPTAGHKRPNPRNLPVPDGC